MDTPDELPVVHSCALHSLAKMACRIGEKANWLSLVIQTQATHSFHVTARVIDTLKRQQHEIKSVSNNCVKERQQEKKAQCPRLQRRITEG
jgi:hypothetical protein